jgi:hypothetical protein
LISPSKIARVYLDLPCDEKINLADEVNKSLTQFSRRLELYKQIGRIRTFQSSTICNADFEPPDFQPTPPHKRRSLEAGPKDRPSRTR